MWYPTPVPDRTVSSGLTWYFGIEIDRRPTETRDQTRIQRRIVRRSSGEEGGGKVSWFEAWPLPSIRGTHGEWLASGLYRTYKFNLTQCWKFNSIESIVLWAYTSHMYIISRRSPLKLIRLRRDLFFETGNNSESLPLHNLHLQRATKTESGRQAKSDGETQLIESADKGYESRGG